MQTGFLLGRTAPPECAPRAETNRRSGILPASCDAWLTTLRQERLSCPPGPQAPGQLVRSAFRDRFAAASKPPGRNTQERSPCVPTRQTRRMLPPDDHSVPRCSFCSVSAKRLHCSIWTALTSSISTTYSWGILAGRPLVSRLIESVDCAVQRPVQRIVFKRRCGESGGTASRRLGSCHCLSVSTDQAGQFRSGTVFAKACDRLSGARSRGRVSSTGRQSPRRTCLAA